MNLAEAIKKGLLGMFAAQEETRGVGPIDRTEFDKLTTALVKAPQSEDRHRVLHLAMVRPERELAEVTVEVLRADMDMRAVH